MDLFHLFLLLLLAMGAAAGGHRYPPNDDRAAELATIRSLVFKKDTKTTGRRTSSVPQLTCVGGGVCGSDAEPQVVLCENIGTDYATGDPSWKCTAELADGVRLGTTDVVCEGFRDRDDPWILRGSCGLEYTLSGNPARSQTQQAGSSYSSYYKPSSRSYSSSPSRGGSWLNWVFGGLMFWLLLRWLNQPTVSTRNRTSAASDSGFGTGGGGGGWGDGWGTGWGTGWGNGWGTGWGNGWGTGLGGWATNWRNWGGGYAADCNNNYGVGGARPGFWHGLGLGAGAGYLFGRNRDTGYSRPVYTDTGYGYGGATYARAAPVPAATTTEPATHTSTGYGTTRRRG